RTGDSLLSIAQHFGDRVGVIAAIAIANPQKFRRQQTGDFEFLPLVIGESLLIPTLPGPGTLGVSLSDIGDAFTSIAGGIAD
ncbi:hypothetical protein ABTJ91_20755, partial [Acinetobacter baumannii]